MTDEKSNDRGRHSSWDVMLAAVATIVAALTGAVAMAAEAWPPAAPRNPAEGGGPYTRLIVDGGMLVDGTGSPPYGPVSVHIEGNRIVSIGGAGVAAEESRKPGTRVIDARGTYILPGLIDTHVRLMDDDRAGVTPDYAFKLLLAHGITTVTSMQDEARLAWAVELSRQSARNAIDAPRIQPWVDLAVNTSEEARAAVKRVHAVGAFGIGEGASGTPAVAKVIFEEANRLGMRVLWHMNPRQASRMNALEAARAGMHGMAHWYNLPETLFTDRAFQELPVDYNFTDERSRFRTSGRLWKQTAPPGSELYERVLKEFLALDFTFEPTFSVYEANRDYMGTRNAEWNRLYLHPVLVREFTPVQNGRFTHFYDWSSTDEVEWKNNFRIWMRFINDYKNRGGRVVAGADAGYMWTTYGFGFIRNLEMMQEAGFTPFDALMSATARSAEHMKLADRLGTVEAGKLADLVVVRGNPLDNLKVFYGTRFDSIAPDGRIVRGGGVQTTIKDGIVYDADTLLAAVEEMVRQGRARLSTAN